MNCERYELWMMDALDGTLAVSDRHQLLAHLNTCPRCRADWDTLDALDAMLTRSPMLFPAPGFPKRVEARLVKFETQRRTLIGGLILLGAAAALCLLAVPFLLNGRNPLQAYGAFLSNTYELLGYAALLSYKLLAALWLTFDAVTDSTDIPVINLLIYAVGSMLALAAWRRALISRGETIQTVRNGH